MTLPDLVLCVISSFDDSEVNVSTLNIVLQQLAVRPDTFVDRSFGQGVAAFAAQMERREGFTRTVFDVAAEMNHYRFAVAEIEQWVLPRKLPADYYTFLESYGGLLLKRPTYNLMVDGMGPMVEEWYSSIRGDPEIELPGREGWLHIAHLSGKVQYGDIYPSVSILLNLETHVDGPMVIGIGPRNPTMPAMAEIYRSLDRHPDWWRVLGTSFTDWIASVVQTDGLLGYPFG